MYDFALIIALIVWLGVCWIYLSSPVSSVFHPLTFYLAIHGLVFVIRPIIAWVFDYPMTLYRAYHFVPSLETRVIVMYGATLGLIAFAAPCLYFSKAGLDFANRPVIHAAIRRRMLPAFLAMCVLILPLAIVSLVRTIGMKSAGVDTMEMVNGVAINTDGNGYFALAKMMIAPILAIFAWLFRFRVWALVPFVVFAIIQATTGSRFIIAVSIASVVLLYLFDKGKRWPGPLSVLGGLAFLVVFDVIGKDRGAGLRNFLFGVESKSVEYFRELPLESMDFGNMEFFEYIVNAVPDRTGTYGYFLSNLQLLTEPIPRVLWENKPIGAPIQLYDLWSYGTPIGMTNSLPGEGWLQLGWFGIVIWCGLWGRLYAGFYNKFVTSRMSPLAIISYAIFMPLMIMFIRDGTLVTLTRFSLFMLIPVLLWWLFDRIVPGGLRMPALRQMPAGRRPMSRGNGRRVANSPPISPRERRRRMMQNNMPLKGPE